MKNIGALPAPVDLQGSSFIVVGYCMNLLLLLLLHCSGPIKVGMWLYALERLRNVADNVGNRRCRCTGNGWNQMELIKMSHPQSH